jgi:DNA-binding transcriptional regulator YdaS (Cro superfamily)
MMQKPRYEYPKFRAWFRELTAQQKRDIAAKLKTSVGYLKQIAGGHSRPSAAFANAVDKATRSRASRKELRPDVFA